ncbi:MAG: hypothetical protein ABH832_02565 [bacterium]
MPTDKINLIKTIYLYLVSFVTLMMIATGAISIINSVLKMYVFTQADDYYQYARPMECEQTAVVPASSSTPVAVSEKCAQMESEYNENRKKNRTADLHNDLSRNISLLVIALPLFILHWRLARKKDKQNPPDKNYPKPPAHPESPTKQHLPLDNIA